MAYLRIFEGNNGVRELPLDGKRLIIGRNSEYADLVIPDPSVSRVHAMILQSGGHYTVKDMESTAGTLLNRKKIRECCLNPGDNIQIGQVVMEFQEEREPDREMADADETMIGIASRFQMLPAGMGLNLRVLQIEAEKVFAPGDTILVGKGGLKIDSPFPEELRDAILELEFIWPTGARKVYLGEILLQHNFRLCIKLHTMTPEEYNRLLASVKRGSWIQVQKTAADQV